MQTFLFYTIRKTANYSKYMGTIEILINGDETEVIDWGERIYPKSDF